MRNTERGFAITMTMVIITTVVIVGLFVGLSAVRDAWFKKKVFEHSVDVYVADADDVILGKAVDFDEHEAPLVPFVDYDVPNTSGDPVNYRVLVGVRDDRFTSRERVYYSDTSALNCTGTPCVFVPSTETSGPSAINSQGVDELPGTGGVSYQLATQAGGGIDSQYTYAVGSTEGHLPGRLYRQIPEVNCEVIIPDPSVDTYISYWQSQRVVADEGTDSGAGTNPPCYQELIATAAVEEETFIRCQGNFPPANPSNNCCSFVGKQIGNKNCGAPICQDIGGSCECPVGWHKLGNNSGWCCPEGSNFSNGQCQQVSTIVLPVDGDFLQAEDVTLPGSNTNVLDGLNPPFWVNLPVDGFTTIPPVGETP